MPKMKTNAAAKKRFTFTGTGKIKRKHAYPKAGVVRSCGVSEIDPALTDELVGLSPHYYVVGVIFEKKE